MRAEIFETYMHVVIQLEFGELKLEVDPLSRGLSTRTDAARGCQDVGLLLCRIETSL